MKTVCCVCRRVKAKDGWEEPRREPRAAASELVSHVYCPECAAVARVELALMQFAAAPRPVDKVA